jgi:hypothetical protein
MTRSSSPTFMARLMYRSITGKDERGDGCRSLVERGIMRGECACEQRLGKRNDMLSGQIE